MAAIIGALQLVFDFGGRAHIHEVLQRRYFELVADIDGTANPTEEDFRKWQAVLGRIYADEPPPMRALDALSYNAACKSMGYDFEHYRRVNFWQWLWSHIYPFPRTNFAPLPAQTTT
jgi:hypothetical protein